MIFTSSKYKILLSIVFLLLFGAGLVTYLFFIAKKQGVETEVPDRATLSGTYLCLSAKETPEDDTCVPGLHTDAGTYYALDFNLVSQSKPELVVGQHFEASGVVTPIESLSTAYWQNYDVDGIFSVTDSVSTDTNIDTPILLGVFEGVLPCADCPGIETKLTLYQDGAYIGGGNYTLSLTYLERNVEPFVEEGEWVVERGTTVDENAVVYALYRDGSETATGRYLKVDDTMIRQLMLDGSPITSGLSYDLVKEGIANTLLGTAWTWIRTEYLGDETLVAPSDAFVLTFTTDGRVTSTTDCNSMSGRFVINGEVLSFMPFAATKMYCANALEGTYASDLVLTNSYVVEGDTLRLNLNRDYGTMFFTRTTE